MCAKKYEFIVELKGEYNWKKTWKNTLYYFDGNFLKRHLKRNGGGSICLLITKFTFSLCLTHSTIHCHFAFHMPLLFFIEVEPVSFWSCIKFEDDYQNKPKQPTHQKIFFFLNLKSVLTAWTSGQRKTEYFTLHNNQHICCRWI